MRFNRFIAVIIVLICFVSTNALSEDKNTTGKGFSFINIDWNDSPKQVFMKMEKEGLLSKYNSFPPSEIYCDGFNRLLLTSVIDENFFLYLGRSDDLPSNISENYKNINKAFQLNLDGKSNTILKKADFSFTCDDKQLLSYALQLRLKFNNEKEEETGEGAFYMGLVEKFGNPTELKHSKKWTKDNQTFYYTAMSGTVYVSYVNNKKIEQRLIDIKMLREGSHKKKANEEKDSAKKMF